MAERVGVPACSLRSSPSRRRRALGDDDDREGAPRRVAVLDAARRPRRCRTAARGRGSRRRRRRCPSRRRSSPRGGPSPRRPSRGRATPAVVCRRSIASVAICTAVWKPNVKSVPARSLSIVFGTPTTGMPSSTSLRATPSVSSPPIGISASRPCARSSSLHPRRRRRRPCTGWSATCRGSCRRGAGCPRVVVDVEVDRLVVEHARPAVAEADELVAVLVDALADDGADDRVESGAVSAAGEDADAHGGKESENAPRPPQWRARRARGASLRPGASGSGPRARTSAAS